MSDLTAHELAVLELLAVGMSNVEIAADRFVSINTVKTHLKSVYRKLGVENRTSAAMRAHELRLVTPITRTHRES